MWSEMRFLRAIATVPVLGSVGNGYECHDLDGGPESSELSGIWNCRDARGISQVSQIVGIFPKTSQEIWEQCFF